MKRKKAPTTDSGRKRLYVYVPEERLEWLKTLSEERQKSVSAIVNELILREKDVELRLDLKIDKEDQK